MEGVPVDDDLARRIREAVQAQEQSRQERDRLVRLARDAGGSFREIAAVLGITHAGVQKIINKRQPPSTERVAAVKQFLAEQAQSPGIEDSEPRASS
jgi:hypothetical protein